MYHSFGQPSSMMNPDMSHFTTEERLLVKMPSANVLKNELRYATQYLTAHKLYHSAKWYVFLSST